ncbi:hypothetical protein Cob_v000099 [Colletotrichum orbiculare MAFF 240422]|uniref:Uncharacterized protein n=1 Tax=Colletotrichum orbiculare (strain 104-T / ATCC 96160 / CBS 514.97 / LARS 414 / MAFF 240422) TaxID=1213857 RepID=A0A484GA78_COLOR|nr:hypothetical protein Cob_v000099 [Colletotrichum orbiculare MAFF 240422]
MLNSRNCPVGLIRRQNHSSGLRTSLRIPAFLAYLRKGPTNLKNRRTGSIDTLRPILSLKHAIPTSHSPLSSAAKEATPNSPREVVAFRQWRIASSGQRPRSVLAHRRNLGALHTVSARRTSFLVGLFGLV